MLARKRGKERVFRACQSLTGSHNTRRRWLSHRAHSSPFIVGGLHSSSAERTWPIRWVSTLHQGIPLGQRSAWGTTQRESGDSAG